MIRLASVEIRFAVLVLCGLTASSRGDDWPQWLGPQRDSIWRESGILEKFPPGGPKIRWRAPVKAGYAGPAVAAGRVFVTDRILAKDARNPPEFIPFRPKGIPGTERVLCLNEEDGKLLWQHEYDCPYTVSYPLGPRATPLVDQDRVYALGTEGHLFCLDAATGKVHWSHHFPKEFGAATPMWGYAAHPLLDGQKLICMVGGKGSAVVAFDKDSGKERWRALSTEKLGYCPPMIYEVGGKRQLIIWHGEAVNGLDPETGHVYWSVPFAPYQAMAISTPRKAGDFLFLTSTFGNSMAIKLQADKPGAKLAWKGDPRKTSFDSVFCSPVAEGDYLYGSNSDGELVCIKADTGERCWKTIAPNGKRTRSADIFLVKNGDRFFLWTEKGDLIIAKLNSTEYKEIDRAHLLGPTSTAFGRDVLWCHPAFANRSIYVRNDKELVCASLAALDSR